MVRSARSLGDEEQPCACVRARTIGRTGFALLTDFARFSRGMRGHGRGVGGGRTGEEVERTVANFRVIKGTKRPSGRNLGTRREPWDPMGYRVAGTARDTTRPRLLCPGRTYVSVRPQVFAITYSWAIWSEILFRTPTGILLGSSRQPKPRCPRSTNRARKKHRRTREGPRSRSEASANAAVFHGYIRTCVRYVANTRPRCVLAGTH